MTLRTRLRVLGAALVGAVGLMARGADSDPIIPWLAEELDYSMQHLATPDGAKPYYLGYTLTERHVVSLSASLGAVESDQQYRRRLLDVSARVGGYELDNTHKLRGTEGGYDPADYAYGGVVEVSLEDDRDALISAVWRATDRAFKSAARKYQRVLTNRKTQVEEEDQSGDFTRETPAVAAEPRKALRLDTALWKERLKRISAQARQHPQIYRSTIAITGGIDNRWMVTSEGTRLQTGRGLYRVMVLAETKADDGMELSQSYIFDAASEDGLPAEEEVARAFAKTIDQVLALRTAPLVEPFTGPAILRNRASAVFFHEIFGHRIEGHRQKDVEEGQTFAKKLGEQILPEFLTVRDDPTMERFEGQDLRGWYRFDDEGVPGQNTLLVENGILRSFLMSRSPLEHFPRSNGHGRSEPGRSPVSRMGNLVIEASRQVPEATLRTRLIEECRQQGKPYGLLFEDITGGFTGTRRMGAQSFKVLPVVVYRVFADGRPDELVRGVDIVGTPLTCFSRIVAAGDDPAVFNGTCGAESGNIPVSAISPSILVAQIEVEKRRREQDRPPILPSPLAPAEPAPEEPGDDAIMRALSLELERSRDLRMEDLEKPYFVQYQVQDSTAHTFTAQDGALINDTSTHQRQLRTRVRVGSMELDNTNFSEGGMGAGDEGEEASLPLEDNVDALRQAIWLTTDRDYKSAVETLTRKRAYLKDKNIVDRPADFTPAPPAVTSEPKTPFEFEAAAWRERVKQASAVFKQFNAVQDSEVRFIAGVQDLYLANSEGTRLRMPDTGALLAFRAEVQAPDGMRLSDGRLYVGKSPAELPAPDVLERDIREVVQRLEEGRQAEVLERYSGPVLFDEVAGAQMFRSLLGDGLAGRPEPVGDPRRLPGARSLEYKLGTRVLPASFQVWDDPTVDGHASEALLGHYRWDDEGVAARRVDLVKDGRLNALCLSRAPIRKLSGSNGHGRSTESGAPQASIANLFIQDQKGLTAEELKAELIAAAKDEGLDFGLRVVALRLPGLFSSRSDLMSYFNRALRAGGNKLGDPVAAYKVSVADGSETPVRGLEFGPVELRALRHIVAAGSVPRVFNHLGVDYFGASAPVAIIAPPVVLEEAELTRVQQEFDTLPLLPAPLARK